MEIALPSAVQRWLQRKGYEATFVLTNTFESADVRLDRLRSATRPTFRTGLDRRRVRDGNASKTSMVSGDLFHRQRSSPTPRKSSRPNNASGRLACRCWVRSMPTTWRFCGSGIYRMPETQHPNCLLAEGSDI
jgi:hypothetical protein